MATVAIAHLRKVYANGVVAVDDFCLEVADGEFVALVGPSGCGKSTTLRMVAGLEAITSGTVAIGGRVVNDLPPKDRDIAMVFQNYALYPHMTVRGNMAFGLRLRRARIRRVEDGQVAETLQVRVDLRDAFAHVLARHQRHDLRLRVLRQQLDQPNAAVTRGADNLYLYHKRKAFLN